MPRKPLKLTLTKDDLNKLDCIISKNCSNKDYLLRCNIILLTYRGIGLKNIADTLNISKTTANRWRQVFLFEKWEGLKIKKVGRHRRAYCNN